MTDGALSAQWSERFGLGRSPMFAGEQDGAESEHDVLLDGGYGSFGLSVVDRLGAPADAAGWAWSSDLPHYVTVTRTDVQVVRWDAPRDPQIRDIPAELGHVHGCEVRKCLNWRWGSGRRD